MPTNQSSPSVAGRIWDVRSAIHQHDAGDYSLVELSDERMYEWGNKAYKELRAQMARAYHVAQSTLDTLVNEYNEGYHE